MTNRPSRLLASAALAFLLLGLAGCIPVAVPPQPLPPTRTPTRTAIQIPTRTPTSAPTPAATATRKQTPTTVTGPVPAVVRVKVEIVWPHGGVVVQEAQLANVTVYLLAGDGAGSAPSLVDSVPCAWDPIVRLWAARDNEPARQVGIGRKRMFTSGGRAYPVWDFNDIDVSHAQDPAKKITFSATVDGVRTLRNVWTHAADARTLFPQQDVPVRVTRVRPGAVDATIQIVWPHGNLRIAEAQRANVTAYLFTAGTKEALAPEIAWQPVVRLHRSLNNEAESLPGKATVGVPRVVQGGNGVRFLAWDFNDIDVSAANDSLNRLTFWVSVEGIITSSNFWTHAIDARTLFPQRDVLNSCK